MFLWTLAIGFIVIIWIIKLNRNYFILAFFAPRLQTSTGVSAEEIAPTLPGKTIFGNTFDLVGLDFVGTFKHVRQCAARMKRSYVQHILGKTILNVIDAELFEMVYTNPNFITKGFTYEFLKPVMGEGLLVSTDVKWHTRRKMLTPAFHFNILAQFQEIFREESKKFIKGLEKLDTDEVLLDDVIPRLTLNVICETALGVKLDECLNGDEYRKNIHVFEASFNRRLTTPHLAYEFIYKIIEEPKILPAIKIVHEFSSNIIKKKRELYAKELEKSGAHPTSDEEEEYLSPKKRFAMLDTLLRAEKEGLIDHAGICEEVDTFIFEGFDTVSLGLIFTLMNLSLYPEMQQRCYEEIQENIHDLDTLDIQQLNKLKYMDCFIKETLRLYPLVPSIMREAVKETALPNGLVLPAKTYISIHLFDLQRDPRHFENPDVFDPERFTSDACKSRQNCAFVPFSAGHRNCIGNKFAMLEMKTLLAHVIQDFEILPPVDPYALELKTGIVIRTKNPIKVKMAKRK